LNHNINLVIFHGRVIVAKIISSITTTLARIMDRKLSSLHVAAAEFV